MKFEDFISQTPGGAQGRFRPLSKKHTLAICITLGLAAAVSVILPSQSSDSAGAASRSGLTAEHGVSGTLSIHDGTIDIQENTTGELITAAQVESAPVVSAPAVTTSAEVSASVPAAAQDADQQAAAEIKSSSRAELLAEIKEDLKELMNPQASLSDTLAARQVPVVESAVDRNVVETVKPENLDNYDDQLTEQELADADSSIKKEISTLARSEGAESTAKWYVETVVRGDSLYSIFLDLNLSYAAMQAITTSPEAGQHKVTSLRPGNALSFLIDEDNQLMAFVKPLNDQEQLRFFREDTDKLAFTAVREPLGQHLQQPGAVSAAMQEVLGSATASTALKKQPESKTADPAAEIKKDIPLSERRGRLVVVNIEKGQAFSTAALASGMTYQEIDQILKLFKGRIQFTRHIQPGDSMRVLFSDSNGKGSINAVEFNLKRLGKVAAYRNVADNKFYDENGYNSSTGTFRRLPLDGKVRITSNFNPNRRHPVTGKVRPHNGTDFGVKIGTPVKTVADGVVSKAGFSKSAGYYIVINHPGSYSSVYMHLSKLHVKQGQRVKIGELIARSGNTGLSTGPHLHFELHRNGKPVNAMRVNLPVNDDSTVSQKQRQRFANSVELYKKELYQDSLIAKL